MTPITPEDKAVKRVECVRCHSPFSSNPLITGDDVCRTCERLNDITFWYPVLFHAGIPVPRTQILHTNVDMEQLSWDEKPEGIEDFLSELQEAAQKMGKRAFLRTGYSSNKHDWKESCYLDEVAIADKKKLYRHVHNLAQHSSLMTIDRFTPCDFWAVREFLEAEVFFTHFAGEMPITKERRIFVKDGAVVCSHSYWPKEVFEEQDISALNSFTDEDKKTMASMAVHIAKRFSGYWSMDFLKGENGTWYCTDMAIGERSYHQPHDTRSTAESIKPQDVIGDPSHTIVK